MSNRTVAYMILIPVILLFLSLFTAGVFPNLLSAIDEQIYWIIAAVFFIGWFYSLFKLWKLPNPDKKRIPVTNRGIIGWTIVLMVAAGILDNMGPSDQVDMLIGLLFFVILGTTCYRLISSESNEPQAAEEKITNQEHERNN